MIGDRPYNLDVSDASLDGITIGVSTKVDDPSAEVASYTTSNGTAAGQSGAKIVMQRFQRLGSTVYLYAEDSSGAITGAGGGLTVGTRSAAIDVTESTDVTSDTKSLYIDTVIPTNTVSAIEYNSDTGVIKITGTAFTSIASESTDVKDQLD